MSENDAKVYSEVSALDIIERKIQPIALDNGQESIVLTVGAIHGSYNGSGEHQYKQSLVLRFTDDGDVRSYHVDVDTAKQLAEYITMMCGNIRRKLAARKEIDRDAGIHRSKVNGTTD